MTDCERPAPHHLGVLFVHGVGEQREGRTLASFASAMYAWLAQWDPSSKQRAGRPTLEDVVLTPSVLGGRRDAGVDLSDCPAHGSMRTRLGTAEADGPDRRWLLAESWWAEVFTPPRFVDLARWLWKVSTCLLVLQFVVPLRRRWEAAQSGTAPSAGGTGFGGPGWGARLADVGWVLVYGALMVCAAAFSVPLATVLLGLAVISKLPIPRIEQAVQWVVVHLSAVVGDSYVLVRCPVEYAAMRTQVARDLDWLQRRCEKVVVVAHSQGAAIAHQVITDSPRDDRLKTLITVGQGISKLHLLDRMMEDPELARKAFWSRWLVAVGLVLVSFTFLNLALDGRTPLAFLDHVPVLRLAVLAAGLTSMTAGIVCASRTVRSRVEQDVVLRGEHPDLRWIDYYASADPVSSGPLVRNGADHAGAGLLPAAHDCRRVYNVASVLTDHTSYLKNLDQFVTRLMGDLVATDLGSSNATFAEQMFTWADRRRHRLVTILSSIRASIVLGALAVWLWDPTYWLRAPALRLAAWTTVDAASHQSLLRLTGALLAAAALYALAVALWRGQDRRGTAALFRRFAPQPPVRSHTSDRSAQTRRDDDRSPALIG